MQRLAAPTPRPRLHPRTTASPPAISAVRGPVWVEMVSSMLRGPVTQPWLDRMAAVGLGGELAVPVMSGRTGPAAFRRPDLVAVVVEAPVMPNTPGSAGPCAAAGTARGQALQAARAHSTHRPSSDPLLWDTTTSSAPRGSMSHGRRRCCARLCEPLGPALSPAGRPWPTPRDSAPAQHRRETVPPRVRSRPCVAD